MPWAADRSATFGAFREDAENVIMAYSFLPLEATLGEINPLEFSYSLLPQILPKSRHTCIIFTSSELFYSIINFVLDSLAVNYTDGVPVQIADKYKV